MLAVVVALGGVLASAGPVGASSGGGRQINDTENTRTVYLVVIALVLLAVGLTVFTWWFWRSTRRDPEALGPLEMMEDKRFLAGDGTARQTLLDANRPVGAAPLTPGAPEPLVLAAVAADTAFEEGGVGEQPQLIELPATAIMDGAGGAAGAGAREPIDPGLPVAEAPAPEQLSLAQLATMDAGFAAVVADDGLTSTPSTGIPVIESPEAWVARQLAASTDGEPTTNGEATTEHQVFAAADEVAAAPDAESADAAAPMPTPRHSSLTKRRRPTSQPKTTRSR